MRSTPHGGETFPLWVPLAVTFREDIAHNAHADLEDGTHVTRFGPGDDLTRAQMAVWLVRAYGL